MKKIDSDGRDPADLDQLIEEITVDAYSDDEKLWAFRQAFEDNAVMPSDGFVIGEPISVVEFDYDGNGRRWLTARCRREDGTEHVVAAFDVMFPRGSSGARCLAAYRRWLGLEPFPPDVTAPPRRTRQHKVTATDLDMRGPVELVVLSVKMNATNRQDPRAAERRLCTTCRRTSRADSSPGTT